MFFGLTIEKLLLIGVVAGLLIGPERLPRYVESLTKFVKRAREYVTTAKTKMKDEMGADFDDVDWRTLDPRQYDPRRIIREALIDDAPAGPPVPQQPVTRRYIESAYEQRQRKLGKGKPAPFDAEST
jgi:sec-independent protein translocase protein TatB